MRTIPQLQTPLSPTPILDLLAADLAGEVHSFEAGPVGGHLDERGDIEFAVGAVGDDHGWRPFPSDQPGQRAGVEAGQADPAMVGHPVGEADLRPVIGGLGHRLADDAAERMGVVGLDVVGVGADIADVGKGEGDHLAGKAGVGHDFLVAGHRGVEAEFAHRLPFRSEAPAPRHPAVGEHQRTGRTARPGRGCWRRRKSRRRTGHR